MTTGNKPPVTGGSHTLPFEKLSPLDFERLCLWLVQREGYERAEHLGEAGSEGGRDVVAWKGERRVVFQCKRVKAFNAPHATKEIAKLRALPAEQQPHELVFVVSQAVSADTRTAARTAWGDAATCHFWAGGELDERVKKHADLLEEFFQLPGRSWLNRGVGLLLVGVVLALSALLWLLPSDRRADDVKRMLLVARDAKEHPLGGFRFAYQTFKSPLTSDTGATELELPPKHAPGQRIKILLASSPKPEEDWFLVNALLNIPAVSISAEVVLMRRSEFRALAAEARDLGSQVGPDQGEKTVAERRQALVGVADHYGFTAEQLDQAIRSFGETEDPKDKGIAAYLEGQYTKAEMLLNEAVQKKETDLVETLRYLGASQYQQAEYSAAVASFRKALALRGEDASLLTWLGSSLHELADWAEAEPLMRRALSIDEASCGPEHPRVAIDLNNLAALLLETNRLAEAEPLMRRALAIGEASFGPEHPRVVIDLNNLAHLLAATNRPSEAEPLMRRALAIGEASFGPDHPDVAICLNSLAALLLETNRLAEAEPLIRRALSIDEASFGPEHPKVAIRLNNLALLLQATNRLAEAEPLMRRAVEIWSRSLGDDHPSTQTGRRNLAILLDKMNSTETSSPP